MVHDSTEQRMDDLKRLFEPRSIALIGVSRDPNKLSHALMVNVVEAGTEGHIYPISRSVGKILGHQTYPSLSAIPERADLVLVTVAREHVKDTIAEAARVNAGVAVILSSGFGETSHESGKRLERELLDIAGASGLRIMGPNCLGVYNAQKNLNGTYLVTRPLYKGNISVVSQSGAYGGILVNELNSRGVGLAKFASTGNQMDLSHQDVMRYLADDDDTDVIGMFVEGVKDGPGFLSTMRAVSKRKPIVVFKGGRTSIGSRAAESHTGSMVGDFAVFRAALQQAGAILAYTTEEFFDYLIAMSLNHHRLPRDNKLAIITISGGPSVIASDCCEELGLSVTQLSKTVKVKLSEYLPSFAAYSNPVDMTVATPPENLSSAVDVVIGEKDISGAVAINWGWDKPEFALAFRDAAKKYQKPVVACAVENPRVQEVFRQNGIPNLPSPERAVKSYWGLVQYSLRLNRKEIFKNIPSCPSETIRFMPATHEKILNEHDSKRVLEVYGIPTCREIVVRDVDGLNAAAKRLGYPVVLKVLSESIPHKSENGGVFLDINSETDLLAAAKKISDRFHRDFSYLLQERISPGTEIMIGMKRDQIFGPVVAFGLGGVFAELLGDLSLRICPLSWTDALEMIGEIRGVRILEGYRGTPPANMDALAETILKVAGLAARNHNVLELDINPLIINGSDLTVVDAMMIFGSVQKEAHSGQ